MKKVQEFNQINRQMQSKIKSIDGKTLSTQPKPKEQKFFNVSELEIGKIYYDSLSSQMVLITTGFRFKYYNKVTGTYALDSPIDKQLFDMV